MTQQPGTTPEPPEENTMPEDAQVNPSEPEAANPGAPVEENPELNAEPMEPHTESTEPQLTDYQSPVDQPAYGNGGYPSYDQPQYPYPPNSAPSAASAPGAAPYQGYQPNYYQDPHYQDPQYHDPHYQDQQHQGHYPPYQAPPQGYYAPYQGQQPKAPSENGFGVLFDTDFSVPKTEKAAKSFYLLFIGIAIFWYVAQIIDGLVVASSVYQTFHVWSFLNPVFFGWILPVVMLVFARLLIELTVATIRGSKNEQ